MNKGKRDWIDVAISFVSFCSGFALYLLLSQFFDTEAAQLESYCEGWRDWSIVDGVVLAGPEERRDHCRLLTSNLRIYLGLADFAFFVLAYGVYRLVKDVMFWRDPEARSKT